jgi:hypothetical protein
MFLKNSSHHSSAERPIIALGTLRKRTGGGRVVLSEPIPIYWSRFQPDNLSCGGSTLNARNTVNVMWHIHFSLSIPSQTRSLPPHVLALPSNLSHTPASCDYPYSNFSIVFGIGSWIIQRPCNMSDGNVLPAYKNDSWTLPLMLALSAPRTGSRLQLHGLRSIT